jgi:hypothetical protein
MSTDSSEQSEHECRETFEAAQARARHNLAVLDKHRDASRAQLREPTARFLADYDRISALTGPEFCVAALAAIERLDDDTAAAYAPYREQYASELRDGFEELCRVSGQLLAAQEEFYAGVARKGETREPSPMGKRFQEQATLLLAEADRIRALAGEDFIDEAKAILKLFESVNLKAVKREIYRDWSATPVLRRWRRELSYRFSPKRART